MKATLNAFLPEYNADVFKLFLTQEDSESAINCLAFAQTEKVDGWISLGKAQIIIEDPTTADLVNAQIQALKEKKVQVLAKAQMEANECDHRIQELLCLEAPKDAE